MTTSHRTPGRSPSAPPASFNPARILVQGFAVTIAVGTLLLSLPAASATGRPVKVIDAFFTATSALCVTGLTVLNTGSAWSLFGQAVIALLVQLGGLGIMSASILIASLLGKRVTLRERLVVKEAFGATGLGGFGRLFREVALLVLGVELFGMAVLFLRWWPQFAPRDAAYLAFFHTIAAFNNAGFDLFGPSLAAYVDDTVVTVVVAGLVIVGGLGFVVLTDLRQWVAGLADDFDPLTKPKRSVISFHSRLTLIMAGILIFLTYTATALLEWSNPDTLGSLTGTGKLLGPFFHAAAVRSAGFYTVDPAGLTPASLFITIVMMFIGGAPASTAGGLKTTTLAVLMAAVTAVVTGKEEVNLLQRRIPWGLVNKALAIAALLLTATLTVALLLMVTEGFPFAAALFQATSATATTGLSLGLTEQLSNAGKLIVSAAMFIGRLGPLTIVFAAAKGRPGKIGIRYREGKVLVG